MTPAAELKSLPADPVALWSLVIDACSNRRLRVLLNDMRLVRLEEDRAVLHVAEEMRGAAVSAERDLATLLASAFGKSVRIELAGDAAPDDGGPIASADPSAPTTPATPITPITPITEHPLVKHAVDLFGARIVNVQPRIKRDAGGG